MLHIKVFKAVGVKEEIFTERRCISSYLVSRYGRAIRQANRGIELRIEVSICHSRRPHRPETYKQAKARLRSRSLKNIFQRDSGICCYCQGKCSLNGAVDNPMKATRDHKIPTSLGGPDTPENIVLACQACNKVKGHGQVVSASERRRFVDAWRSRMLARLVAEAAPAEQKVA